jgi:hypothetical protein
LVVAVGLFYSSSVPIPENSEKRRIRRVGRFGIGKMHHAGLADFAKLSPRRNNSARRAVQQSADRKGTHMLGRIAGALIGEHFSRRKGGAKGAIIGVVAETMIRKVVPTLAAVGILTYAYKKSKNFFEEEFGGEPDYPPGASPSAG